MNSKTLLAIVALWSNQDWLDWIPAYAAEPAAPVLRAVQTVRFIPVKGRILIEGTSNIDDWRVETKSIGGFMEVSSTFPSRLGQNISASPIPAQAEAWIKVRSLRSIEKDGKPFSNKMDDIMYEALQAKDNPEISYRLTRWSLRAGSRSKDSPAEFDARGQLVVAGVTNDVSMPVNVLSLGGNRLKVWGTATLNMTDFRVEPPSPKITLGLIKTGDGVKLSFEWLLARRAADAQPKPEKTSSAGP
jgi:hypothetical protein